MIKFTMTSEAGRKILGLIITKGNIERLIEEQPIHFNAEQMGLSELKINEIFIAYYDNEEEAKEALIKYGLITEETIVHEDKLETKQ